jgi:hypothetical protein
MKKHEQRPAVLYVHNVIFHPKLPEPGERVTVIDIEITEQMAKDIIEAISKRLHDEEGHIAAIRIRMEGRIVLT